ncbi:STAS domain-containing protein [candidate division KSB1 bacterium]|nr:STAS domain-containing protein [candidate division KSB1 bacterium]
MEFQKESIDDVTIIRIESERLDTNVAPELKAELIILAEQGILKVLIDISKVYYADSSGLGALLFGVRQYRDHDGQFKLLGANTRVQNLIRIAKLDHILTNFDNEQSALESFKTT